MERIDPASFSDLQPEWSHWHFSAERGGLMARTLVFAKASQCIAYRMNHMELLHRPVPPKAERFHPALAVRDVHGHPALHAPASTWHGCPCQYFCSTQVTVVTS